MNDNNNFIHWMIAAVVIVRFALLIYVTLESNGY